MVKIAFIILGILIVLDIIFQILRRKRKDSESKRLMDEYLLKKYSKKFKCLSFGLRDAIYDDAGVPFSVHVLASGDIRDNRGISKISNTLSQSLDFIDLGYPSISSCRISSFENFDDVEDFSLSGVLSLSGQFLINTLTIVSLPESDFSETENIIKKLDSQMKAFPSQNFTRNIIFVNQANFAQAKKFVLTYPMSSGDLSEYTGHIIKQDTKNFDGRR